MVDRAVSVLAKRALIDRQQSLVEGKWNIEDPGDQRMEREIAVYDLHHQCLGCQGLTLKGA